MRRTCRFCFTQERTWCMSTEQVQYVVACCYRRQCRAVSAVIHKHQTFGSITSRFCTLSSNKPTNQQTKGIM